MDSENRPPLHPLIERILREGPRLSFFEAARLLQALSPDCVPVGREGPPEREALRFEPELSMSFANADLRGIEGAGPPFRMETTFLSIYGAVSPLPAFYTEDLLAQDDPAVSKGFLDLFHHRLISLFYRAWEKYRIGLGLDPAGADTWSRRLLQLAGLGSLTAEGRAVPAVDLLAWTGILTRFPRSADAAEAVLRERFRGLDATIEPCVPRWLPFATEQRTRLGRERSLLGSEAILGERLLDRSSTFRVRLGPLGREEFLAFLPRGSRIAELREMVDAVTADGLAWEVMLVVRTAEAPPLKLGAPESQLGWSTWLGTPSGADQAVTFLGKG